MVRSQNAQLNDLLIGWKTRIPNPSDNRLHSDTKKYLIREDDA